MKKISVTEVPWAIMIIENNCEKCDRLRNCTYKDLVMCFISKTQEK